MPAGAPEGWPDPEAEAPGLDAPVLQARPGGPFSLQEILPDRHRESMNLCSPQITFGPPGAQQVLSSETERVAYVGDCVDVTYGSSEGKHHIVESCD